MPARQSSPDMSEAVTKDQNNSIKMGDNIWSELFKLRFTLILITVLAFVRLV